MFSIRSRLTNCKLVHLHIPGKEADGNTVTPMVVGDLIGRWRGELRRIQMVVQGHHTAHGRGEIGGGDDGESARCPRARRLMREKPAMVAVLVFDLRKWRDST
jgi:hypothetical protein